MLRLLTAIAVTCLTATAFADSATAKITDGQTIGYIVDSNNGQIEMSQLALTSAQSTDTKGFATHMIKVHEDRTVQMLSLAKKIGVQPAPSDDSAKLEAALHDDVKRLKTLKGITFDKNFLQQEIDHHRKVIAELNERMVPDAQNAELKKILTDMRVHVAENLAKAEKVLASLK